MQQILTIYLQIGQFFKSLFSSFLSILKVILLSKFSLKLPKPTLKKASILGNGPSLRATLSNDLAFIKTTDIYAVNLFASSAEFVQIQPQNYVMLDPAFFLFDTENSSRLDIKKTLDCLIQHTNWEMNLYVPYRAKKSYLVEKIKKENHFIKIVFFNYTIIEGFSWFRHQLFNLNLGMTQCQNILACTLFLAIRRQYDEIFLFGADHSWHEEIKVSENNDIEIKQIHFYDNTAQVKHQKILDVNTKVHSNLETIFLSLYKVFYGYGILKKYADYQSVRVFNASGKSYIDSFERVKL
ncbi:hypothetical protein EMA8858_00425 [Emticicia aquatica]|uniref:DUF115 domain-containing protein n=1 Tax=Emticicia aquatica TaxID=1681835 RepID=A0ABN8ER63_9BACT|nr:hypothetical protein [Emticicia aquatica]CAH0994316.1 hypothetical protein EMA8858_00425 [Emticicia aquatica]